jgi:hypothetical protein
MARPKKRNHLTEGPPQQAEGPLQQVIDGYIEAKREENRARPFPPPPPRDPDTDLALTVRCPSCRAGKGELCMSSDGRVHARRKAKAEQRKANWKRKGTNKGKGKSRSVWTVSGGAPDSNRRRH